MKIYTELSLGKTDPGLREPDETFDITKASERAALVESLGFDGMVSTETKDDSFIMTALAANATSKLEIATSVAIAFARAPYVTAMAAWRLQALSRGRFTLGLGPQVKAHLIRRFGLQYTPPGPWMRDYVGAVRAFWDCWQNGTPLNYESEHYKLNLMVPLFNPGPMNQPPIPIHIASLNTYMAQVAGEVADGFRPHPVCTPKYITEVMKPAFAKGAAISGRDPSKLAVAKKSWSRKSGMCGHVSLSMRRLRLIAPPLTSGALAISRRSSAFCRASSVGKKCRAISMMRF
jgi:probable F420-dependent oxidoreductase